MVRIQSLVVLTFISLICKLSGGLGTGFWYGETRGPIVYDSLPFTNLSVKVNRPLDEGPGQNLFRILDTKREEFMLETQLIANLLTHNSF